MRGAVIRLLLCLGLGAWVTTAVAQRAPARVELSLPPCPGASLHRTRLEELLRVELESDGVQSVMSTESTLQDSAAEQPPRDRDTSLARITLRAQPCEADPGHFVMTIDDAATRKRLERVIHVDRVGATRALALAAAELLRASWLELALPSVEVDASHVPEPVRAAVAARLRQVANRADDKAARSDSVEFDAGLMLRAFPGARTSLLGGRVGSSLPLGPGGLLKLRLEGGVQVGESLDRLGRIELGLASGGAGLRLETRHGIVALQVGPLIEVGWGWAAGKPNDPGTRAGDGGDVVVLASLDAVLAFRISQHLGASVGVTVGAAAAGHEARVNDRAVAGVSGSMLGITVGPVLRL